MGRIFKYLGSKESMRALWENKEALDKYLHKLRELMTEGKKLYELTPVYCVEMPAEKEEGKLYISNEFQLAIHLCACGCGGQTVTPLGDNGWSLTDNQGKITLRPSIGNFSGENPYHAHYYITDNHIEWL
jgi:hypothetical protein